MKGDFSRWTFDRTRSFSQVLMQQGRVLLDADWNEQGRVLLDLVRQLAGDLIGPHGGPQEATGFKVEAVIFNDRADLMIGAGRYWVDGLPCELPVTLGADGAAVPVHYSDQPHLPLLDAALPAPPYLVYLDVWERHVTVLEDPALREVALGGADTCSRAEVVWQVRVVGDLVQAFPGLVLNDCRTFSLAEVRRNLAGDGTRGALKARARRPDEDSDPCITPPEARYRGQENQLYRVEVHRGGPAGQATFKWSRENGSVLARWLDTDGARLTVAGVRDGVHGFQAGDWVELTDDPGELRAEPGVMVRLSAVEGDQLTVDPTTASGPLPETPGETAKVRRWEQRERADRPLVGGALPIEEGTGEDGWLDLENGLQVQFQPAPPAAAGSAHLYRSGDSWLIPARTASGDVEWPGGPDDPQARPPQGIEHHLAPLAWSADGASFTDLRRAFGGLAQCAP